MSGDSYVLDTNIVLYILNGNADLTAFLDHQFLTISVITEMELLSYPAITRQEITSVSNFLKEMHVISLDEKIRDLAISIRRKYKLKLPDSIVAATSIFCDLPLITADKQFKKIEEMQLLFYAATEE